MVLNWKCDDSNRVPVGTAYKQPTMDTHVYEVHFPDGRTKELALDTIVETLYAQCDSDGNQYVMLDTIVDYRKNPNVAYLGMITSRLLMVRSCSIKGWEVYCDGKDGNTSWQKLSDLKESHPLQVTEFALAAGILDEPASNWCMTCILMKRDWIVYLVKCQST
ncbi:LOW QUALITY PROTEIN: hypothetical protein ACHAW6_001950 [Cyclotella cf. meneghiniana]